MWVLFAKVRLIGSLNGYIQSHSLVENQKTQTLFCEHISRTDLFPNSVPYILTPSLVHSSASVGLLNLSFFVGWFLNRSSLTLYFTCLKGAFIVLIFLTESGRIALMRLQENTRCSGKCVFFLWIFIILLQLPRRRQHWAANGHKEIHFL